MDGTELANAADHPALAFLNTRSNPWGEPIELLATGASYLAWLVSSGLLEEEERAQLAGTFATEELDGAAAEARETREWLRGEVIAWVAGDPPAGERLNTVLARDHQYLRFDGDLRVRRRWEQPGQLLVPPVAAAAELFARGDGGLVRECDGHGCGIWFYDRTKSHRRRWCSQAVCGNRDKVRNHRQRAKPPSITSHGSTPSSAVQVPRSSASRVARTTSE